MRLPFFRTEKPTPMSTDIALETPPSIEETNGSHPPLALEEDLLGKAEKKEKKRLKKEEKKRLKLEKKSRARDSKSEAVAFPMVALIDEQVRTSIPEELVAKVKGAKKKSEIISPHYPYPKRMKSEDYNEEIELLQIELVKMQAWVKETGERIVMPPARAAPSSVSPRISIRAARGSRRWPSPPTASAASGISSATSKTCRPRARSFFSTAPGTTARAWSTSWASAHPTSTWNSCARRPSSSA
jgi:hypothetical protein